MAENTRLYEPKCALCGDPEAILAYIDSRPRWLCYSCSYDEASELRGEWMGTLVMGGWVYDPEKGPPEHGMPVEVPPSNPHLRTLPWGRIVTKENPIIPWYLWLPLDDLKRPVLRLTQDDTMVTFDEHPITMVAGVVFHDKLPPVLALGMYKTREDAVVQAAKFGFVEDGGSGVFRRAPRDGRPRAMLPIFAEDYAKYIDPGVEGMVRRKGGEREAALALANEAYDTGFLACALTCYVRSVLNPQPGGDEDGRCRGDNA